LQPVAGTAQASTGGSFQALIVRVTDSSSPPNPVVAANVVFQTTVLRNAGASSNPTMPIILNVSQGTVASDLNGLASIVPSSSGFSPPVEVNVAVADGTAFLNYLFEVFPGMSGSEDAAKGPPVRRPINQALSFERQWR
jgi:hypothetical protein